MRASIIILGATLAIALSLQAQSPPNACGLLSKPDVDRLITRGHQTYHAQPEAVVVGKGKGSLCLYVGGQVGIYVGPNSAAAAEGTLKSLQIDKVPRQPVSGIGDKAFLLFPPPIKMDSDHEGPFLVITVGEYTVTAFLTTYKGQADGPMSAYCRDSANVKKRDQKSCRDVLADKSEAPESLRPLAEELGKILATKVRSGKL